MRGIPNKFGLGKKETERYAELRKQGANIRQATELAKLERRK